MKSLLVCWCHLFTVFFFAFCNPHRLESSNNLTVMSFLKMTKRFGKYAVIKIRPILDENSLLANKESKKLNHFVTYYFNGKAAGSLVS